MWDELIELVEETSKEHEVEFRYWIGTDEADYEYISMNFEHGDYGFVYCVNEYDLKVFEPALILMQIHKRIHRLIELI